MELNLTPNPLHQQAQILRIDKVATLIGENGSGKSSILQSVFEQRLAGRDHKNLKVVCFSSGQNENYSAKFSAYLKKKDVRVAASTLTASISTNPGQSC